MGGRWGGGLAAAVLSAVLLVPGCGRDTGLSRDDAIAEVRTVNPEVTAEQAGCVVDHLIDRFGLGKVGSLLEASAPDPDFQEAQFTDMFRCGVEGDVRQQILDQLTASGVPDADAPCVADVLVANLTDADVDVLLSGEITSAFAQKFDSAMRDCGAAP
jgi:hypothetical protein